MTSSNNKPVASAILAVYNAEASIVACLESLALQSVPIEIIVIDDGSTDNTKKLLDDCYHVIKHSNKSLQLLHQSHLGPAVARNLGAKHAKSDILLFVDADMTFDKNYVRDLIAPIISGTVKGTYTVEERVSNWDNVWARCWNIQEGWAEGKRFPPNPPKYGTDYRAILKSEFERVGGFDNIGYTDTWSLFAKLGVRPLFTKAICYHRNPSTLLAIYHQARWSAKRPYKYGILGTIYALIRTSLPISLIVGPVKAILYKGPTFVIFKLVYDWGRFVGIIQMLTSGKTTK